MSGFVLALRAHEYKRYYDEYRGQIGPHVFAVALVPLLDFPGSAHSEGRALSVVCASRYETSAGEIPNTMLWGWVHLDPEAKEEIGRDLEERGAEVNRWYYLELSYDAMTDQ